ncbi:response regulator transcription factor [Umboniibacter marinipuniceus]|uniref:LuxR family two component transcriptional regulator n=1 Tax=Umboniibacter marinipuniceus TaxID=569599 RepID=A0A3M0AE76_9GAMM|nr:response regulator [Umboniibacter marinipuniceus]RMA81068.1 LuxR family two component transcriptional regulator [Umboniibacter marinipuniceus]
MSEQALDVVIYVVDDDEAVRGSISFLMKANGYRCQTFVDAQDFLANATLTKPAVGIFDIRMPGMSGLELFDELKARDQLLPVVFVTGHGDVPMAVEAIKNGALDFILKPFDDQELLSHIEDAVESMTASRERQVLKETALERLSKLTDRESQVMEMVVAGNANKVIAYDLEVSQRTVEIHRANVMQKMGCRSLAQLVRMVMIARSEI